MATVWYLRGPNEGQFGTLDDREANQLAKEGVLQIFDGVTPLMHPENHRDVKSGAIPPPPKPETKPKSAADEQPKRRGRPRQYATETTKYANKVMTTGDAESGGSE